MRNNLKIVAAITAGIVLLAFAVWGYPDVRAGVEGVYAGDYAGGGVSGRLGFLWSMFCWGVYSIILGIGVCVLYGVLKSLGLFGDLTGRFVRFVREQWNPPAPTESVVRRTPVVKNTDGRVLSVVDAFDSLLRNMDDIKRRLGEVELLTAGLEPPPPPEPPEETAARLAAENARLASIVAELQAKMDAASRGDGAARASTTPANPVQPVPSATPAQGA